MKCNETNFRTIFAAFTSPTAFPKTELASSAPYVRSSCPVHLFFHTVLYRAKLLTTLLEFNPYNSTLDLEINQQTKNRAEAELRAMSPLDSDGKRTGENILECSPSKPSGVDGEKSSRAKHGIKTACEMSVFEPERQETRLF